MMCLYLLGVQEPSGNEDPLEAIVLAAGDALPPRNLLALERSAPGKRCQINERDWSVFAVRRKPHGDNPDCTTQILIVRCMEGQAVAHERL